MNTRKVTLTALLCVSLLAACATSPTGLGAPASFAGDALVGSNGMTLYTFDKDIAGSGKSVCNGPCAGNWPPLLAEARDQPTGDWSLVTRDDGKKQWAFKGKPLYFWIKDQKMGDRTGDGVNNVWHVAR